MPWTDSLPVLQFEGAATLVSIWLPALLRKIVEVAMHILMRAVAITSFATWYKMNQPIVLICVFIIYGATGVVIEQFTDWWILVLWTALGVTLVVRMGWLVWFDVRGVWRQWRGDKPKAKKEVELRDVLTELAIEIGEYASMRGIQVKLPSAYHSYTTMTVLMLVHWQTKAKMMSEDVRRGLEVRLGRKVAYEQTTDGTLVIIEKKLSECKSPDPGSMLARASGMDIPVAVSARNEVITVNLQQNGAFAYIGPSGRGKSTACMSYLFSAIKTAGADFIICAPPGKLDEELAEVDWRSFEGKRGCLGLVEDFDEMRVAMTWLADRVDDSDLVRPTLLVVDDMVAIKAATGDLLNGMLTKFATIGRSKNAHLVMLTQKPGGAEGFGAATVADSVTARVVFRFDNSHVMTRATGLRKVEANLAALSMYEGDVVVIANGGAQRAAAPLLRLHHMDLLPDGEATYPWRQEQEFEEPYVMEIGDLDGQSGTVKRQVGHNRMPLAEMVKLYSHMFPAEVGELNPEQCAAIRELDAANMSMNRLCWVAYCLDPELSPRNQFSKERKNRILDVLDGGTGVYDAERV